MKILDLDLDFTFEITQDFGSTISTIHTLQNTKWKGHIQDEMLIPNPSFTYTENSETVGK